MVSKRKNTVPSVARRHHEFKNDLRCEYRYTGHVAVFMREDID